MFDVSVPFEFYLDLTKAYQIQKGDWIVEALASTVDLDLQTDMIMPEATYKAASDLLLNSTVLFNHDGGEAIGRVLVAKVIEAGLFIKLLISKTASKRWQEIKEGTLRKLSIRGKVTKYVNVFMKHFNKVVRLVKGLYLIEVSLVPVAANPQARTLSWYVAKSLEGGEEFIMSDEKVKKDIKGLDVKEARTEILDVLKKLSDAKLDDGSKALLTRVETIVKSIQEEGSVKPEDAAQKQADGGDNKVDSTTKNEDGKGNDVKLDETKKKEESTSSDNDVLKTVSGHFSDISKTFSTMADAMTVIVQGQQTTVDALKNIVEIQKSINDMKRALENLPVRKGQVGDNANPDTKDVVGKDSTKKDESSGDVSEVMKKYEAIKTIDNPYNKLRALVEFATGEQTTTA